MVDPTQKSLVDTLGSQLMTQQATEDIAPEASTYDRMGQLLGLAVATTEPDGDDVTGKARAITEAVGGAALMESPGDVERRAPLVLVVLGTDAGDEGSDAILTGLSSGLAAAGVGVVVAGTDRRRGRRAARDGSGPTRSPPPSPPSTGSTPRPVGWPPIRALARSLTTQGGAFGASGADGPLPLG